MADPKELLAVATDVVRAAAALASRLRADGIGEVSTKFQKDQRVWIVREDKGMYALWAKCTHLGCTPRWLTAEAKFKCPCHGSGFYKSGVNFEGPAPRPLERLRVTKAEDGQLVIDKGVKYLYEKGDWNKPGAFLKV